MSARSGQALTEAVAVQRAQVVADTYRKPVEVRRLPSGQYVWGASFAYGPVVAVVQPQG